MVMVERWTPDSWRGKPVKQMPVYPDAAKLEEIENTLKELSLIHI